MRGISAWVLTLAFVFAGAGLFIEPVSAQSTSSLEGTVCSRDYYYGYTPAEGNSSKGCMGSALPGVTLRLTKPGPVALEPSVGAVDVTAASDESGYYRFQALSDGEYTLTATRTGFAAATFAISISEAEFQDISLTGETVNQRGKVVDSAGKGIANAEVEVCCPGEFSSTAYGRTAANGSFVLSLRAGTHSVNIRAPGFENLYESRLLDGSSEASFAMRALPPPDATIKGTVRDQDGRAVEGARVSAYTYGGGCCYAEPMPASDSGTSSGTGTTSSSSYPCCCCSQGGENFTFTDSQGRYAMKVYSGSGSLNVQKEGYAGIHRNVQIPSGQTVTEDVKIMKYPDKTARIEGRVTDLKTGKGVPFANFNLQSPQFGLYECSQEATPGSSGGGSTGSSGSIEPASPDSAGMSYRPGYYNPGCAITMHADGTFEGTVTPGYTILQVWHDNYRACSESTDADGSSHRTCGPEYYSWSLTTDLPANETTTINVALRSRPAPDAVVEGYLVDKETDTAIPGAQISFSNLDSYGYGYATTDGDGSYSLRLRSGPHQVYVYANGYLRWEGILDVEEGDTAFDVPLTPGDESYGGCCYAYASSAGSYDKAMTTASTGTASPTPSSMGAPEQASDDIGSDSGFNAQGGGEVTYEDLGGGLGPYDADRRGDADDGGKGAPGLGLVAMLCALGAVLAIRRRLA